MKFQAKKQIIKKIKFAKYLEKFKKSNSKVFIHIEINVDKVLVIYAGTKHL
jgi:hypothetical protein